MRFAEELLRSEEHTSELQSHHDLVCRLLLEKKNLTGGPDIVKKIVSVGEQDRHIGAAEDHLPEAALGISALDHEIGRHRLGLGFFFNDPPTTEIYTLSLHDALPISIPPGNRGREERQPAWASSTRPRAAPPRSEEHTSELQSHHDLVCRLLLEKKKKKQKQTKYYKKKKKKNTKKTKKNKK